MRTLGRILLGGVLGLIVATTVCFILIFFLEWALASGWTDRYDDVTLAMLLQALLMAGPIVGGWWAWVRL